MKGFYKCHPLVNMLFFIFILAMTMFVTQPVFVFISFFCSILVFITIKGLKRFFKTLKLVLIIMVLTAVINPLFNHEGMTILTYFPNGNPLTKESIVYGFFMSVLFGAVILWFEVYCEIMDSDKFIYLFGRILPQASLLLSMCLRYIPRFKLQYNEVKNAQKCIGKAVDSGRFFDRIKNFARIISVMISWSFENAIETSDSMKSRGYGLGGRTAYSIYKFDKRDGMLALFMSFIMMLLVCAAKKGMLVFYYYPMFASGYGNIFCVKMLVLYGLYLLLGIIPAVVNIMER